MQTTSPAVTRLMSDNESMRQAADYISFADNTEMVGKNLTKENFSRVNRFQCTFCFGSACTKERFEKCKDPYIHGLHSNLIEGKIIGSQRPSTRKMEKYNVI